MSTYQKVLILGHVGRDPEIRHVASGGEVALFSVATSRPVKAQDGSFKEATEWHRVVAFGKVASFVGTYAKKGHLLFIEGRLQTRSWEKDGQKHYSTEVVAEVVKSFTSRAKSEPSTGLLDFGDEDQKAPQDNASDEDVPF